MKIIAALAICLASSAASAQTLDDLKNDGKNPDNILTYGMGYSQQRHSPLKEINKISASTINGASRRSRSSKTA
jgi:alcohol dehydrogenase (cytochrome c)